jgi:hypothetical protein
MKKEIWLIIILGIIIIGLAGVALWPNSKPADNQQENPPDIKSGIQVAVPESGAEVSSPLIIRGTTNGDGWNGFEGQVGTVKLLDYKGDELALGILTAATDWMQPPVSFETTLNFTAANSGPGTLVFKNENPSGEAERDQTFTLPVNIIESSAETIIVKLFFNNSKMDPEFSCDKVFSVDRNVPKVQSIARVALGELLKGPTDAEKNAGFFTSINPGVVIQSLTIENGTAKVDFNDQLDYQVGGSCRVAAIRAEITETLKQFPTVGNVIISINGRTEDILQP